MLIIVCGLPGTGKSTLAQALAAKLGAEHISSDIIRRKMLEERTYSEQEKYRVYERMVQEAEALLREGKSVVADATFYRRRTREQMLEAARRAGKKALIVECVLDEETVEERMEMRKGARRGESEADFSVYLKVKALFEPIREGHLVVDTGLPLPEQVKMVIQAGIGMSSWKKEDLLLPEAYPDGGGLIEVEETHISYVFLAGEYAYKIKKPVKFSFLDFSTIQKRKEMCEEEVRLNRRLSPEIYVGVAPLLKRGQSVFFGRAEEELPEGAREEAQGGSIVEYAVKMRRIPRELRMDSLLLEGKVRKEDAEEIAGIVSDFHSAVPVEQDPQYNSPEMLIEHIEDLSSARGIVEKACGMGKKVDSILEKSAEFIAKNEGFLRERQAEGMVRECHGDLHSKNVFFGERKFIFDCIEFNEEYRFIDVASEVAFMAMDLDAHGGEDLSRAFVEKYAELSADSGLERLLDFYKCYRANVRAKIAALSYAQRASPELEAEIRKYLSLAERYAEELTG
ncbi:MAG: AAA family ATPase [Candidatus Bilamarchaeaceae archaeon]